MNRIFNLIASDVRYSIFFLIGISSFFYIGLGHVHLFDWDEINFAESAREMIRSGDYMLVQINYSPFWEKPPLFFWLQVLSMKVFGITEFAARFPNAVFGTIYLITFYLIGRKHFSPRFGLLWALLFFGSLLPHIYFKSGIIDPVFNFFIFLSIYFMVQVIEGGSNQHKNGLLSGIFSGLSVLTKGPVGFLILAICFGVYVGIKKFKNFPNIRYFALFIFGFMIIVSSWLAVEFYQNGTENMLNFILYQIELFTSPVAGHEQPFYYHFLVVLLGCFPISIFAIPLFFKSDAQNEPYLRLWMKILFWVVIVLFSITTTKIIHYSSLTYIPLSALAAMYLQDVMDKKKEWKSYLTWCYCCLGFFWSVVFIFLPLLLKNKSYIIPLIKDEFAVASLQTSVDWSGKEFVIGLLFLSGWAISAYFIYVRQMLKSVFVIAGTMMITLLMTTYYILPGIEEFTQGTVIKFYQSIKDEDAYIESYGYKSYAQYFYADQKFGKDEKRKDQNYLLNGDIEKPVYLVTKSTNRELDSHPGFKLIKADGGFRMYKREPVR
jgi:4-amino-4-deoxy-L-arabinose transferase-like glycosyltransferase